MFLDCRNFISSIAPVLRAAAIDELITFPQCSSVLEVAIREVIEKKDNTKQLKEKRTNGFKLNNNRNKTLQTSHRQTFCSRAALDASGIGEWFSASLFFAFCSSF